MNHLDEIRSNYLVNKLLEESELNTTGCIEFIGKSFLKKGTIIVYRNGMRIYPAKYLYEIYFDKRIESRSYKLFKICNNRLCINPEHHYIPNSTDPRDFNITLSIQIEQYQSNVDRSAGILGCHTYKLQSAQLKKQLYYFQGYARHLNRIEYFINVGEYLSPNQHIIYSCNNKDCLNYRHMSLKTDQIEVKVKKDKRVYEEFCVNNESAKQYVFRYPTETTFDLSKIKTFSALLRQSDLITNEDYNEIYYNTLLPLT